MDSLHRVSKTLTNHGRCLDWFLEQQWAILAPMSDSLITKKALAGALKDLVASTPLAKVAVADIVNRCGLQRQTFYYHFKDKYELVNWIYESEAVAGIADCADYTNWTEGIRRVFTYLAANRIFYVDALNTPGHSTFDQYLFTVTKNLILRVLHEVACQRKIRPADMGFIADFYAFAFVGLAVRWIKAGMKDSPEELTSRIRDIVDGSMERALDKFVFEKSSC